MELLRVCICLLAKQTEPPKFYCCAIKLRGIGIGLGDLIARAFPDAKSIFLYRNAEDVIKNQPEPSDTLEIRKKIDSLLKKHPAIKTPDFIVPNTLGYPS